MASARTGEIGQRRDGTGKRPFRDSSHGNRRDRRAGPLLRRWCHPAQTAMLRFAEEILVLVLDEARGELAPALPARSFDLALAGAVLMDLALEDRIDTDPERLILVDSTPLGDDILDPTLSEIASAGETHDTGYWLEWTARRGRRIRKAALARLTERGVLRSEAHGVLSLTPSVSRSRRYPVSDGQPVEEARLRIMRILFSDDVPDPRDIAIIALANACGVFRTILSSEEREQVRDRIDLLKNLDLIGRTMSLAIEGLDAPDEPAPEPRRPKEIPVVPGLPLLGNGLAMRRGLVAFLARQYRELGPIFRIRAPGRRFVCIAGPEAANFLTSHGKTVFRSLEPMASMHNQMDSSRSIVTMDGIDHVTTRKAQAKGYAVRIMRNRAQEVVDITRDEIGKWSVGEPFEALPAFQDVIGEQMGHMMAGYSPEGYTRDLSTLLGGLLLSAATVPHVMRLGRFRRARERARELAQAVLAHKRKVGPRRTTPDFIDLMLELREADPQLLPETNLPLTVLAPYMVGLDTTASTCAFMIYNVVKHPQIMESMTAEADALFDRGRVSAEGLKNLDVARRVAMETLRLHPVSPAVLRTTANSFEFAGHRVRAGTQVMIGTAVGHTLEEYFPDPERFDIDRYTPARGEHRQRGAYAPFGAGNHRCLGSGLVPVQLALTMATILRELELEPLAPGYALRVRSFPTMQPMDFRIRVLRRRAHSVAATA
ncbi:MAG: cytochrome P450 [Gemmatimonadetes bacterium]|nr:cytochrome P450 [Gemmatimonadota bacterium]MYC92804.1 cytochrome P450 [Gemmatimonadota bacterium]